MQSDTSGPVETVETELVLVTGRCIEAGELFWPEEDALYLLAPTWQAVDPRENGNDSVSSVIMIDPESGELAHKAEQGLIELTFTPQAGGVLWRAVGALGASDVFQGALPRVVRFLSQQEALGAFFSFVALYQATKIACDLVKDNLLKCDLVGCAMAADIPFSPIP